MPRFGVKLISFNIRLTSWLAFWFFLATGCLFAGTPSSRNGDPVAPKAHFANMRHNFGEVFEGVEIKYDFIVENKGNAPLVIKNIQPD